MDNANDNETMTLTTPLPVGSKNRGETDTDAKTTVLPEVLDEKTAVLPEISDEKTTVMPIADKESETTTVMATAADASNTEVMDAVDGGKSSHTDDPLRLSDVADIEPIEPVEPVSSGATDAAGTGDSGGAGGSGSVAGNSSQPPSGEPPQVPMFGGPMPPAEPEVVRKTGPSAATITLGVCVLALGVVSVLLGSYFPLGWVVQSWTLDPRIAAAIAFASFGGVLVLVAVIWSLATMLHGRKKTNK